MQISNDPRPGRFRSRGRGRVSGPGEGEGWWDFEFVVSRQAIFLPIVDCCSFSVVSAVGLMNGKYASGDPVYIWSTSQESWLETTVGKIFPDGKIDTQIKLCCLEKIVRRTDDPLIACSRVAKQIISRAFSDSLFQNPHAKMTEHLSFLILWMRK